MRRRATRGAPAARRRSSFCDALVGSDRGERLVGDLPAQPQRPLDGDAPEAERLVGEDLDLVALGEVAVEPGDLGDLLGGDLLALVAEALAHLHEEVAGVDELDLAPCARASCGW